MHLTNRPPHPGEYLQEILTEEGLTQQELANRLGVERKTVHNLLKEKSSLTVEMSERIAKYTRSDPAVWLRLQIAVDIYDFENSDRIEAIEQIQPSPKVMVA